MLFATVVSARIRTAATNSPAAFARGIARLTVIVVVLRGAITAERAGLRDENSDDVVRRAALAPQRLAASSGRLEHRAAMLPRAGPGITHESGAAPGVSRVVGSMVGQSWRQPQATEAQTSLRKRPAPREISPRRAGVGRADFSKSLRFRFSLPPPGVVRRRPLM